MQPAARRQKELANHLAEIKSKRRIEQTISEAVILLINCTAFN
jgi:hypothetical protein